MAIPLCSPELTYWTVLLWGRNGKVTMDVGARLQYQCVDSTFRIALGLIQ